MNVTYTYDGGGANWSNSGILVAHVRGGTPGEVYALDSIDGNGNYVRATADSNGDCDVTMDTIGGTVGLTFAYLLVRDSGYGTISGCLIKIGTTGTQPNIAGTATWNGTDTFQLTLDSPTNLQTYLFYWDSNGQDYSSDGSATIYTATLIGSLWGNKDYLVTEEYDSSTNTWFDSGLWWVATGDTTVFIPPFGAGPLTANFRGTPLFGVTPLTVNFTDRSSAGPGGAITNWDWHFGDGGTSNVQNPSHVYNVPGIYAVSLTVTSPDGTDTKTLTNYIQVFAPSTNTDCASAFPLSPSGGTMVITNQFASDTPADQDPFGHIWPIGPGFGGYDYSTGPPYTWVPKQLSRQVWYKCTNTSSEKLFFRLVMQNFTGGLAACLYFGCPNPVMAYDPVGDHTVPIFEIPDTPQIWPPYGNVLNGGFLGTQGYNNYVTPAVTGDTLGIVLDPGQTVYIEFGGDDVYPYYSYPYGPGHGWNGTMDITWDFHSILQWRDGIDNFLSPDDTSMPDISQNDRSGTVPSHQELDPSGFDLTAYTTYEALAVPTIDGPTAYGHFNNHHFVTAPRFKDLGDFYPDGSYRGAGWGNDQLGVWELDENGNQVNFWIIFEGVHTTGLSLINSQAGNGITGNDSKFCTDGTNLWLVVVLYELVLNPYGGQFDANAGWVYTWAPSHTVVFSYTGSGWTRIGAVEAATSNTLFFNNLVGGYGGNGYSFDACASPDEPGVLHVVVSEWGVQDGPGGVYTGLFESGHSGTSPRQIRWQTSYGRFSPTGQILKTTLDEYNAAAGPVADASIGSHSSNPGYCWVRNDGGSPVYFRLKGIDQFGTQLPTDTFEMYDLSAAIDGGSGVPLLETITTTDLYSLFARNSPPIHTYDELLAGSLSENAPVDIASDGKRVWYLNLTARASTLPYYYNDDYPLLRIPVDRSSPFLYFENDIHKSFYYGIVGLQNWYVYCESKQTWMLDIYSTNIAQYIRCMNTWYQWPGWVTDSLGYIQVYPPGDIYPTLTQKGRGFAYNRDDFYYGAWFYKDAIGNPAYDGGFVGANLDAVGKSRILRDYFICQIDITPAVMRQSIFWFFKDGTWHNAGNDPNYNLWFYRNGMWRSHLADSQHALYGQLNSSWQN